MCNVIDVNRVNDFKRCGAFSSSYWLEAIGHRSFFSFSEGDCCIKMRGCGHHKWKILGGGSSAATPFKGEGRQGRPKRGPPSLGSATDGGYDCAKM